MIMKQQNTQEKEGMIEKTGYVQGTAIRLWLLFQGQLKTVKYLQVLKQNYQPTIIYLEKFMFQE